MNNPEVTTAIPGTLFIGVLVAAVLTAITSVILLRLYRRATLKAMGQQTGGAESSPVPGDRGKSTSNENQPLILKTWQAGTSASFSSSAETAYHQAIQSLYKATIVYMFGGLAYALIFTLALMLTSGKGFHIGLFLWLLTCYTWPTILAIRQSAATKQGKPVCTVCIYFAIVVAVAISFLISSPESKIFELVIFWFYINTFGTVLFYTFLHRRIRSVGPLVLAFMVTGVTGSFLAIEVLSDSEGLLFLISRIGYDLGLSAIMIFILMLVFGFVILGILGRWFLGWIGQRYRAKRLSDQSLTMDSMWLMFGVVQSINLYFEGWGWVFTGLVAFTLYKLVTRIGFALINRQSKSDNAAPMYLLLRVFALGRRSERFFNTLSKWWRRSGSISLIAGPDLATTMMEPHEFLEFISGRLSGQFVKGEADLKQRLSSLDRQADPDGLYRVNEFFCHTDTWQMTMQRLAKESDAILMDLRGFSLTNHGCFYELEQLLNIVDLARVLILVDETTDHPLLKEKLQQLWQEVDSESPNLKVISPTLTFFHTGDQSWRSVKTLLLMLFGARAAG